MDWKDNIEIWMQHEQPTSDILRQVDVNVVIPLKSELHVKNLLLKEEIKYLNHWISQIDSSLIQAQMNERIEFIEMELKKNES